MKIKLLSFLGALSTFAVSTTALADIPIGGGGGGGGGGCSITNAGLAQGGIAGLMLVVGATILVLGRRHAK